MEDSLIIGIDISKEKDISCMTVARKSGRGMQVINQLFNKEAEDIYYKLINISAKAEYPIIREEAVKRGMTRISNMYSSKELLETVEYTTKIQNYSESQRNYILNHCAPKKVSEILAAFWLKSTNDEFFNYFKFNWVPSMKIQEEARKKLDMFSQKDLSQMSIPLIKANDVLNNDFLNDIQKTITSKTSCIDFEKFCNGNFMRGATDE